MNAGLLQAKGDFSASTRRTSSMMALLNSGQTRSPVLSQIVPLFRLHQVTPAGGMSACRR
jgi:hypothetical protein